MCLLKMASSSETLGQTICLKPTNFCLSFFLLFEESLDSDDESLESLLLHSWWSEESDDPTNLSVGLLFYKFRDKTL